MPQGQSGMGQPLRENLRHGNRPSAREMGIIHRALNWAHGLGGIRVRMTHTGLSIDGGGLMGWKDIPFGYELKTGAQVEIKGGYVCWGDIAPKYVNDTTVTITASGQYVGLEIDLSDTFGTDPFIMTPTATLPANEPPSIIRYMLFRFDLTNAGRPKRTMVGWCGGDVHINGVYGTDL